MAYSLGRARLALLVGVSGAALLMASPASAQVDCYNLSSLDARGASAESNGTACGPSATARGSDSSNTAVGSSSDSSGDRADNVAIGRRASANGSSPDNGSGLRSTHNTAVGSFANANNLVRVGVAGEF